MNDDMTINVMRLGWYNVQQHHELQYYVYYCTVHRNTALSLAWAKCTVCSCWLIVSRFVVTSAEATISGTFQPAF